MKPQFKKYLLLIVVILVATAALYAQGSLQDQPKQKQKQEQAATTPSTDKQGESMMMDCCKKGAMAESGSESMEMMKKCHAMMGKMEKKEKTAEHPAGCSMMGKAKSDHKEKTNK